MFLTLERLSTADLDQAQEEQETSRRKRRRTSGQLFLCSVVFPFSSPEGSLAIGSFGTLLSFVPCS